MKSFKQILAIAIGMAAMTGGTANAQSSPSAYTFAVRYDAAGRAVGTISPDPDGGGSLAFAATRTTYDAAGRVTKVETGELSSWQAETVLPSSWTGFTVLSSVETTYDAANRKLVEISKGSDTVAVSAVQYSYNANGLLECSAQRLNPSIYGSLPSNACSLGTEGSLGPDRITRNTYDAVGRLTKIQKAYGTALQEDYATYTYSANGKQTSLTDARGYKASMAYDTYDRQVKWNFPSPTTAGTVSTTDYEEYGYDTQGNRTSLRKRDGSTITFQYDALNRNIVKVVPERSGLSSTHSRDVYYGYDLRGLQTYARFDSGATSSEGLSSTYDGFGRATSTVLKMDGTTRALSYASNKNGARTELTWPDSVKASYAYDGLDRLSVLYDGALGSTVNMVNYGYNNRGGLSSQTGRYGQATSLGFDPVGRLNALSHNVAGTAQDVAFTYEYSPASQMTQQARDNDSYAWAGHYNVDRNYAANGLNQYTTAGSASFTYDANGNLTSDGGTTFVYDVENRLVSASGSINASLRYDPLGRIYEAVASSVTTRFLHDGDEMVAEYDGSGSLLRRYAHGKNVDDPVVWYEGSSNSDPRWLHTDHQGSVIAISNSSGAVFNTNTYDEYGIPASANIGRFQYTGQAWLPQLGMYYYKARIYSPTLGRFLQTDPIGYQDQINLYAYVGSDPVNLTDPSGTCGNVGQHDGCFVSYGPASRKPDSVTNSSVSMLDAIPSEGTGKTVYFDPQDWGFGTESSHGQIVSDAINGRIASSKLDDAAAISAATGESVSVTFVTSADRWDAFGNVRIDWTGTLTATDGHYSITATGVIRDENMNWKKDGGGRDNVRDGVTEIMNRVGPQGTYVAKPTRILEGDFQGRRGTGFGF